MTVQYLLEVMEWDEKSSDLFIGQYATMRRIKLPNKDKFEKTLETAGLSPGEIEEAIVLKGWLAERAKKDPIDLKEIKVDFNEQEWERAIYRYKEDEEARENKAATYGDVRRSYPKWMEPVAPTQKKMVGLQTNWKWRFRKKSLCS